MEFEVPLQFWSVGRSRRFLKEGASEGAGGLGHFCEPVSDGNFVDLVPEAARTLSFQWRRSESQPKLLNLGSRIAAIPVASSKEAKNRFSMFDLRLLTRVSVLSGGDVGNVARIAVMTG